MNDHPKPDEVRIHINREAFPSPNPTAGEALYVLGDIPKHDKLFREAEGKEEDVFVPRNDEVIHLIKDQHFYSQKVTTITVNEDDHEVDTSHITYQRVIDLFLGSGGSSSNQYLVKYSHGPLENQSGVLTPGQKVKVKDGMRFRVSGTGES
jgi:hypothetical protein